MRRTVAVGVIKFVMRKNPDGSLVQSPSPSKIKDQDKDNKDKDKDSNNSNDDT